MHLDVSTSQSYDGTEVTDRMDVWLLHGSVPDWSEMVLYQTRMMCDSRNQMPIGILLDRGLGLRDAEILTVVTISGDGYSGRS